MKNHYIHADSTSADSSGDDNTVSITLFTHSFPRSGPKKLRKIAQTCLKRLPLSPSLPQAHTLT